LFCFVCLCLCFVLCEKLRNTKKITHMPPKRKRKVVSNNNSNKSTPQKHQHPPTTSSTTTTTQSEDVIENQNEQTIQENPISELRLRPSLLSEKQTNDKLEEIEKEKQELFGNAKQQNQKKENEKQTTKEEKENENENIKPIVKQEKPFDLKV